MAENCCAELVARCFAARTAAHFAHLKTHSYSEHKALESFYEDIVDRADTFAEAYMGVDGIFESFPSVTLSSKPPLGMLTELHDWITKHRTECADGHTELGNLIDEILSLIDSTYYKLKNLR
jgi:DNA-binding ferritin-like protein